MSAQPGKNRDLARAVAALLGPPVLGAYVLAIWSLAADLAILQAFPLAGRYSHWQVWLALAGLIQVIAAVFERYGASGRFETPPVLAFLFPARKREG